LAETTQPSSRLQAISLSQSYKQNSLFQGYKQNSLSQGYTRNSPFHGYEKFDKDNSLHHDKTADNTHSK